MQAGCSASEHWTYIIKLLQSSFIMAETKRIYRQGSKGCKDIIL